MKQSDEGDGRISELWRNCYHRVSHLVVQTGCPTLRNCYHRVSHLVVQIGCPTFRNCYHRVSHLVVQTGCPTFRNCYHRVSHLVVQTGCQHSVKLVTDIAPISAVKAMKDVFA